MPHGHACTPSHVIHVHARVQVDSRHGFKRLAVKCVVVAALQRVPRRSTFPRHFQRNSYAFRRDNICDSDTECAHCGRFERLCGVYGSFGARFGTMLDDRLFPTHPSSALALPLPFLARSDNCAPKSTISAGSIPDIWFRERPISCVYGNLSPAWPTSLDFVSILFQLDALKTFPPLSRLCIYTSVP